MTEGAMASMAELFQGWRTRYGHLAETFCTDGWVSDDLLHWRNAAPRVLFLAKETNDRKDVMREANYDLCKLLRDSAQFDQNVKTFERNLAIWALGLHAQERGQRLDYQIAAASPDARAALLASAVMNVKKLAGSHTCNPKTLRDTARQDSYWILQQIRILAPTVIVCCGTFDVASRAFGDFSDVRGTDRCHQRDGVSWIDQWHPSYPAKGGPAANYERLMDAYAQYRMLRAGPGAAGRGGAGRALSPNREKVG